MPNAIAVKIAIVIVSIFVLFSDVAKCYVDEDSALNKGGVKGQSSNQISVEEEEGKPKADEQVYYLPLQTVFGETHTATGAGSVSTTSPPHIAIQPAPIQTHYYESTGVSYEDVPVKEYNVASQCVSETPAIELESRFLFSSQDTVKESVIMSGHLEVPSKTSSIEEASEEVSKPSVVLQGTEFHYHTVSDL